MQNARTAACMPTRTYASTHRRKAARAAARASSTRSSTHACARMCALCASCMHACMCAHNCDFQELFAASSISCCNQLVWLTSDAAGLYLSRKSVVDVSWGKYVCHAEPPRTVPCRMLYRAVPFRAAPCVVPRRAAPWCAWWLSEPWRAWWLSELRGADCCGSARCALLSTSLNSATL